MSEEQRAKSDFLLQGLCPSKHPDALVAKLRARSTAGQHKYGITLARDDLSEKQWLQHAQEEALDLAAYLERLMIPGGNNSGLITMQQDALSIASELETRLNS